MSEARTTTGRLGLPMIEPGQAQKELFHNEALLLLDTAVQAVVEASGLDAPPPAPALGSCYLVGSAPTGDWAGQALAIAGWTAGGWRFVAAREGMAVWNAGSGAATRFCGGDWRRGAPIADPTGGTTVDIQARAAVSEILGVMRAHGLIIA